MEIVGIRLISLQLLDKLGVLSSLSKVYYVLCVRKKVRMILVHFFQS